MTAPTQSTKPQQLAVTNRGLGDLVVANQQQLTQALAGKPLELAEFVVALDAAVALSPELANIVASNPNSVRNAMLQAALLGLRPGPVHKHFALVPFKVNGKPTCVGITEWRGLIDVATRAGSLDSAIVCDVVYECDVKSGRFAYDPFTGEVKHAFDVIEDDADKKTADKLVAAYATCKVKGRTGFASVVLRKRDVEKRRASSKAWSSQGAQSVWGTDPVAMWKKTAVRALLESGRVPMNSATLLQLQRADQAEAEIETEVTKVADAVVVSAAAPQQTTPVVDPPAKPAAKRVGESDPPLVGDIDLLPEHLRRQQLIEQAERLIFARSKGDPERGAGMRVEIEQSVGAKLEDLPIESLAQLVKAMSARVAETTKEVS